MLFAKKMICLLAMAGLLWASGISKAQAALPAGVDWHNYAQAMEAQKDSGKTVMLVFTIPYCYRCKKMAQGAYTNPDVLAFLKKNFIPAVIDLAEAEGKPVGKKFNVSYTPTHIFLGSNGEEVYRVKGVVHSERFLKMLQFVASGAYRDMDFDTYEDKY